MAMRMKLPTKTHFIQLILAMVLLGTAALPSKAQTFEVNVDGSFVDGDIRFTGELGIVYTFLWRAIAQSGELAICGVGRFTSPRLRTTVRGMLRDASINVSGLDIPFDVSYFTSARTVQSMRSEPATCRSTGIPVSQASGGVYLSFGQAIWRN
ncbi:hypothetical protein [Nioella sp. MMSF_3534]|uniref:hypothetical protein n=1 Tax=Nioella sp. MMSF_3534 TaxID=3046720 RepID=UPI00273F5569|nr:hypothetical protein [Nioella sp. MMSF_3534]